MRNTTKAALLVMAMLLPACTHNIAINTRPPGATAQLAEVGGDKVHKLGQTPVKTDVVGTGEYTLTLNKQGFSPYKKKIVLGEQKSYDIELVPVYDFSISTEPEGAKLVVEDRSTGAKYNLGKSPARYTIEGKGPFSVTASMRGYEATTTAIETSEGATDVFKTVALNQRPPVIVDNDQANMGNTLVVNFDGPEGGRIEVANLKAVMPCKIAFYSKAVYPVVITSPDSRTSYPGKLSIYPESWDEAGYYGVMDVRDDVLGRLKEGKAAELILKGMEGRIAAEMVIQAQ